MVLAMIVSPVPPQVLIRVGDMLEIESPDEVAIACRIAVRNDGTVVLPNGVRAGVATRSPGEAADRLVTALEDAGYGVGLRVSVRVTGRATRETVIFGAVSAPFEMKFGRPATLGELLDQAHPLAQADPAAVLWHRADGTVVQLERSLADVRVPAGDLIEVPISTGNHQVIVAGGVTRAIALDFRADLTLGKAIEAAGGLTAHGDPNQIVVHRGGESIPRSLPDDADFRLRAADEITVARRSERKFVMVRGAVVHPGLVEWAPGIKLTALLQGAGGLAPRVKPGAVVVQVGQGKALRTFRLSLPFLLARRIPDPMLPSDAVLEFLPAAAGDRR